MPCTLWMSMSLWDLLLVLGFMIYLLLLLDKISCLFNSFFQWHRMDWRWRHHLLQPCWSHFYNPYSPVAVIWWPKSSVNVTGNNSSWGNNSSRNRNSSRNSIQICPLCFCWLMNIQIEYLKHCKSGSATNFHIFIHRKLGSFFPR